MQGVLARPGNAVKPSTKAICSCALHETRPDCIACAYHVLHLILPASAMRPSQNATKLLKMGFAFGRAATFQLVCFRFFTFIGLQGWGLGFEVWGSVVWG